MTMIPDYQHGLKTRATDRTKEDMRDSSKVLVCSLILTALTGCAVGPNYKQPKMDVPAQYRPTTTQTAGTEPLEVQWWRTFNDPLLNQYIVMAWEDNLDIQVAAARVREARALRRVSSSAYWPDVRASGAYSRSKSGGDFNGNLNNNGGGERDLYQAGFDAIWELDVFGGIRRSVEAATADIQSAEANLQNTLITLYGEVARNYIELRGFQRQIEIAEDNVRAQRETLELTQTRYKAGLTSDLDVARAEAQVASTLSQIPELEISARAAGHRLGVLLGREPSALLDELDQPQRIPQPPPAVPVGIPTELLRRRPDIRAAERALAAETARIGVATADLFPRFTLTGDLTWSASQFKNIFNSSSLGWSAGPGVSWSVFNAGRVRGQIAAQEARTDAAVADYKRTVLLALEEVQNALVAFQNDQIRRATLMQAVEANQRAVNLSQQLYQRGLADFLNVLQAQFNLFASQTALVRSDAQVSADIVALFKSLGGGWEETPTAAPATQPAATQPVQ
jgi:multidrug efflux system outer membrane protein